MSILGAALRELSSTLECRWALVGGLAVSARAEPRLTRDIDVAVAVENDSAAEAIVSRLISLDYQVVATVEQEHTKRLATVRLRPPGTQVGGVVVDLLFASCGIEPEIVASADQIEVLDGISVGVAKIGHLFAMKVLSQDDDARPQDRIDLAVLGTILSAREQRLAATAVTLIEERGYNRKKDLRQALTDAVTRFTTRESNP